MLKVSRSAYYDWLDKPIKEPTPKEITLVAEVKKTHASSKATYGYRRIHTKLVKSGYSCSKWEIRKIMKYHGLTCRVKRKFKATTNSNHNYPVAPNLVNQNFKVGAPKKLWFGDITYIGTDEGWLYFAAVLDAYHKKIPGMAFSDRITKELTITALQRAIDRESPLPGLIFHSDRGSQYAAYAFQDLLKDNGIIQSMSRKGNCYDNACMESFFATLKKEAIFDRRFRTREEAKLAILEYVYSWYNSQRIHSVLGMSPMEFEKEYYNNLAIENLNQICA